MVQVASYRYRSTRVLGRNWEGRSGESAKILLPRA